MLQDMVRGIALAVLAACSGGPGVEAPRERTALRLVECTPAQPLVVEVDGRVQTHGRVDGPSMGWAAGRPGGRAPRRAVTLGFGMAATSGRMDAMLVRRTISARQAELQRCYERELAAKPSLTRLSIAWRFAVAQDGHVVFAEPVAHSMSSPTSACISRVFRLLQFPKRTTGGSITVTQPLIFDTIPLPDRASIAGSSEPVAWTPFAIGGFAPERATAVARAAERALRTRAGKLEACFRTDARGSLRALLGVEDDGDVAVIRAGGIGDAAVEACIEKELLGLAVVNPAGDPAEIACDFARGDARAWRVAPRDRYAVITTSRKAMTFGSQSFVLGALDPVPLPAGKTYLIVADPDTPGSVLAGALAWAGEGDASIVALRDGERGAPVYLGMGRAGYDDALASRPLLVLGRNRVQACIGQQVRDGKLADAGQLALRLARRCRATRCGSLAIGIEDLAPVKDLVELTGAARRAGFEHVQIAGGLACDRGEAAPDDEP